MEDMFQLNVTAAVVVYFLPLAAIILLLLRRGYSLTYLGAMAFKGPQEFLALFGTPALLVAWPALFINGYLALVFFLVGMAGFVMAHYLRGKHLTQSDGG